MGGFFGVVIGHLQINVTRHAVKISQIFEIKPTKENQVPPQVPEEEEEEEYIL